MGNLVHSGLMKPPRAQQTQSKITGVWVPVVTPFSSNGDIDLESLDQLCRHVLAEGATGLVALGTTGEPATLDDVEQREVVLRCASICASMGRGLMIGVGTNSTRSTIGALDYFTHALRSSSVDLDVVRAALVVVPYYTRPSLVGVVEHFRSVALASPFPLVAYNVPYRTGVSLPAETVLEIAGIANIDGLKQAVGALDRDTLEVLRSCGPDFSVLAGDDAFIVPTIAMGGSGTIAAAAHVCTRMFATMVSDAQDGRLSSAVETASALLPVVTAGFAEPNPAVWKAALFAQGIIASPAVRSPLQPASSEAGQCILAALATAESRFVAASEAA